MKNKIKAFSFIAIVLIFTLSAASCSGQSGGGGKSLNSAEELKKYLDSQPMNSPDKPINVSMTIKDPMLKSVADIIMSAKKYVSLNITGNALTSISDEAFKYCDTLVSITILNYITSIGEFAFSYCTSLTSITIPNSVTSIGEYAFNESGLTSITIPDSVNSIGGGAFAFCTNLTNVTFQGTISSNNLGGKVLWEWTSPFLGDLSDKYLAGGIGTYTTTAPVDRDSKWTKK